MAWKPPATEAEWSECLTAYLDGELPPDEAQALEEALRSDPRRARQLVSLRSVGSLLEAWDVPEPAAACRPLQNATQAPVGSRRRLQWGFQAALFLLGLMIGANGALFYAWSHPRVETANVSAPVAPAQATQPAFVVTAISPAQAEDLLREVAAAGLKDEVTNHLREREWDKALAAYEKLMTQYGKTTAAAEAATEMEDAQTTLAEKAKRMGTMGRT